MSGQPCRLYAADAPVTVLQIRVLSYGSSLRIFTSSTTSYETTPYWYKQILGTRPRQDCAQCVMLNDCVSWVSIQGEVGGRIQSLTWVSKVLDTDKRIFFSLSFRTSTFSTCVNYIYTPEEALNEPYQLIIVAWSKHESSFFLLMWIPIKLICEASSILSVYVYSLYYLLKGVIVVMCGPSRVFPAMNIFVSFVYLTHRATVHIRVTDIHILFKFLSLCTFCQLGSWDFRSLFNSQDYSTVVN